VERVRFDQPRHEQSGASCARQRPVGDRRTARLEEQLVLDTSDDGVLDGDGPSHLLKSLGIGNRGWNQRVERLSTEVDGLHSDVAELTDAENSQTGADVADPSLGYLVEGGVVAVQGPGLTVRLDDAPADSPRREDVSPDDLVVHQQDIQSVMNALWAGGAEAMELMDQRVVSTSAIHCAGNVLRLHGRIYSPPYDIRAVGDPDRLRRALSASLPVQ